MKILENIKKLVQKKIELNKIVSCLISLVIIWIIPSKFYSFLENIKFEFKVAICFLLFNGIIYFFLKKAPFIVKGFCNRKIILKILKFFFVIILNMLLMITSCLLTFSLEIRLICIFTLLLMVFLDFIYIKKQRENITKNTYFLNRPYNYKITLITIFAASKLIFYYTDYKVWIIFIWQFMSIFVVCNNLIYKKQTKEQFIEQTLLVLIFFLVIGFFIGSCLYDLLVLKFVFGVLAISILFYNLIDIFISDKKAKMYLMVGDLLIGIGLTIYLLFLIPPVETVGNYSLKEIVTTVVSALYGGLFTMVGVAWTIKKSDENKKEETRSKYRPFVNCLIDETPAKYKEIKVNEWLSDTFNVCTTETEYCKNKIFISDCFFANTDFANFYVWGILINEEIVKFKTIRFIRKNEYFQLAFSEMPIYIGNNFNNISLILEDMLENKYELKFDIRYDSSTNKYFISGNYPTKYLKNIKI